MGRVREGAVMNPLPRSNFDSDEEYHFYHWLLEAESYGLVSDIRYHAMTFPLFCAVSVEVEEKQKTKEKTLFQPHEYEPDFWFNIESDVIKPFFRSSKWLGRYGAIVDVKGTFQRHGGARSFSINQKLMWEKYGQYVEKVVPEKLFKKTWVPEVCRLSPKKKQPVKKYIGVPTVKEFLTVH